jgi:hypothetical protein
VVARYHAARTARTEIEDQQTIFFCQDCRKLPPKLRSLAIVESATENRKLDRLAISF